MSRIAHDGDLGDLGKDQVGAAGDGLSPELRQAFLDRLKAFQTAVADLDQARNQAEQAVEVVLGWVEVGQHLVQIAGPILQQWAAGLGAKRVPEGGMPGWYTKLVDGMHLLDGLTGSFFKLPDLTIPATAGPDPTATGAGDPKAV